MNLGSSELLWGVLWDVLAASWACLGLSGAVLEPSWVVLGLSEAVLEPALLGRLEAL